MLLEGFAYFWQRGNIGEETRDKMQGTREFGINWQLVTGNWQTGN